MKRRYSITLAIPNIEADDHQSLTDVLKLIAEENVRQALKSMEDELRATLMALVSAQKLLNDTRNDFYRTWNDLSAAQDELFDARKELSDVNDEIDRSYDELSRVREEIYHTCDECWPDESEFLGDRDELMDALALNSSSLAPDDLPY